MHAGIRTRARAAGRRRAPSRRWTPEPLCSCSSDATLPERDRPGRADHTWHRRDRGRSIFGGKRSRTERGAEAFFDGLRGFWGQTALLLVVLAFVNGSNYPFHVVISRMLGPADYGALAALLAVVLVLSVPFGVVQTAVADKTATLRATGPGDAVRRLGESALKTTMPFAWAAGLAVA